MKLRIPHYLLAGLASIALGACSPSHPFVEGTSSMPELEGKMLYLKAYADGDLHDIDSSRVIHGKFAFAPKVDSTLMVSLFIGEESVMPVVLEGETPLHIQLSEQERRVTGTALNDTLFAFIRRKAIIDAQLAELPHRESQMIMDGMDHDEIMAQLRQEAAVLSGQEEQMVMSFIKANMDNVLGPGIFMIVTSGLPFPMMTPEIEELVTLGTPSFLADRYVADFVRMARENMEKMNDQ